MVEFSDQAIIKSWNKNAAPWAKAVENGEIESRIAVTNQAVLDAVLKEKPASLLDVGCGESWESLFEKAGYSKLSVSEPRHPVTGKRQSLLFVAHK